MDVGREIRRLREARGWSQAKLAGDTGMGVSGISQIETGTRNPSAVTLAKIAGALGVEVGNLFPKEQAPLPDLEDERRTPSLQSWIDLVNRLADRWEQEIEQREREWQAAKPAVRKVKRLSNFHWANEICGTAGFVMDAPAGELERNSLIYDIKEVLDLYHSVKRLGLVVDRTEAWFRTAAEDAPKMGQVHDLHDLREAREAVIRIKKRAGIRAS